MNAARKVVLDAPKRRERRPVSDFEHLLDGLEAEEEPRRKDVKPKPGPAPRRERRPFAYD